MRIGPFTIKLPAIRTARDPYWELFVNAPPSDPSNFVADALRRVPEGSIYPIKTDIHSPEIMSGHIKEFAHFLGADLCGIVRLDDSVGAAEHPFGIVFGFGADYDLRHARGIGGQAPALKGAFVTFVLGAWIRECGYRATRVSHTDGERLAAQAGLGRLDVVGHLSSPRHGAHVYIADVLHTDLPLTADGEVVS